MADPTREDLLKALRAADAAGDAPAAQALVRRLMATPMKFKLIDNTPQIDPDTARNTAFVKSLREGGLGSDVIGAAMALGEAAKTPLLNARNRLFPKGVLPGEMTDAEMAQRKKEIDPLLKAYPVTAGLGDASVKMAPAIAGGGPTSVLRQALAAAASSGATADPGQAGRDAAVAGGLTLGIGGLVKALGKFGATATDRANRTSLKIMRPDAGTAAKAEYDFGSWEAIGQKIHDLGLDKPGVTLRERRGLLRDLGEKAGVDIESALTEAERRGATVDVPALLQRMGDARDALVAKPGAHRLTDTLRSAEADATRQIVDLGAQPEVQTGSVKALENAKRALQDEGFLASSRKFPDPAAARRDPSAAWYRAASGEARQAVEDAVGKAAPDVLPDFLRAKEASGVAHVFEEPLTRAANTGLVSGSGLGSIPAHVGAPRYAAIHAVADPVLSGALPYWQMLNRGVGAAHAMTPAGTAPTVTQILAGLLRDKANLTPQETP
jgi:hypothetical protein